MRPMPAARCVARTNTGRFPCLRASNLKEAQKLFGKGVLRSSSFQRNDRRDRRLHWAVVLMLNVLRYGNGRVE